MTNKEMLKIAMKQSAYDSNCNEADFINSENKVVLSALNKKARKYLESPFLLDLTSYGNNIVASVSKGYEEIALDYINKFPVEHCFETPNLLVLMEKLKPYDTNICFMAEYFLPDMTVLKPLSCSYEVRILTPDDFKDFYLPMWSNALCEKRRHLDVLAAGAFDQGKLIGLAGCSADYDSMWQIGVDVLPEYRRQSIASALTSTLADEIIKRGKVPFYCCAWSNIKSARNAIKSGFRPSWVQVTAKKNSFIEDMNR